jgi:hypothetical protein
MATPEGLPTVTLAGQYLEPDILGTPMQGSLVFSPSVSLVTFPDQNVLITGSISVNLDETGSFTITMIATDTAHANPSGWSFTVTEKIVGVKNRIYNIFLPYTTETINLADITPTDAAPVYLPVVGPQGPPGVITTLNGYSASTVDLDAADVGAIATSAKGAASGVASLDSSGLVLATELNLAQSTDFPNSISSTNNPGTSARIARLDHTHSGMDLVSGQTAAGAKVFSTSVQSAALGVGIAPSSARSQISSNAQEIVLLVQQNIASPTNPIFLVTSTGANDIAFGTAVGGDADDRFNFQVGGKLSWGTGAAVSDTSLLRSNVNELTTGLLVVSTPTSTGHATTKAYVDGSATYTGTKTFSNASSSALAAVTIATGDTNDRFTLNISGLMSWGPGTAATDVTLYRESSGVLGVTGQLIIDIAAPTAAGHVTRKDYVDNNYVSLAGTQTITGAKTITGTGTMLQVLRTSGTAAGVYIYNSTASGVGINLNVTAYSTDRIISSGLVADTVSPFSIYGDGQHQWGAGGSAARDTNLYRKAANVLATDDNLSVGMDLYLPGGTFRNTLSSAVTVANTVTETILASCTIPASDMVVGADYRITAWGIASVTGTPTITFNARIGGVAGGKLGGSGARTAQSGAATRPWKVELQFTCLSTGTTGTTFGNVVTSEIISVSGGFPGPAAVIMDGSSAVTVNTTVSQVLCITAVWSAASASNTVTCEGWTAERVS